MTQQRLRSSPPESLDLPREDALRSAVASLQVVLHLEASMRSAANAELLANLVATDWGTVVGAQQIFVVRLHRRRQDVLAVTGVSSVERNAPLIVAVSALARRFVEPDEDRPRIVRREALEGPDWQEYPLPHLMLAPLVEPGGTVFGAVLLARSTPWGDEDVALAGRLSACCAHAWLALEGKRRLRGGRWQGLATALVAMALAALGAVPVPLSALAPVEVVPRDPDLVTAAIDGVVRTIAVEPNAAVKPGDVLVRFADTALRGRLAVAEQNVAVAQARERRLAQSAFDDRAARRELAVATSELRLAEVERDAARDALDRAELRATKAGVAVFQSRKDLEGRPVAVGERLMSIARPEDVELRIDLPVKDSILAREGAPVRVYLDADPLDPLEGTVEQAAFAAAPVPGGGLAFILRARIEGSAAMPRIGYRGTAQVRGETVSLAYLLLRRPLTAARQHLGL
ncbi:HlyD family efflux transporter periplasmic adaptor subunit [uncultured Alsobacter sp.]|uniref:efflux RND transporter periplasmic adaptor subunit n=1 Tax=uncultured Alsobacter sp. TaxID=1748258 RepID=UPI0025D8FA35|nr:HlyD family efflux transporter periplasmic adaptor subunit [uncultured Alsobacter sp.]